MDIKVTVNYTVSLKKCEFNSLTAAFKVLLVHVFTDFFIQVAHLFTEAAMAGSQLSA